MALSKTESGCFLVFWGFIGIFLLLNQCEDSGSKDTKTSSAPLSKKQVVQVLDNAEKHKKNVNQRLSEGNLVVTVNQNTESSKLEGILKQNGFIYPTVTEGVRINNTNGYIWKLEVIEGGVDTSVDWYVEMETDFSIVSGKIIEKYKGSPWNN